jgi:surface polysaccharide O-acyltransferase-like enzyme
MKVRRYDIDWLRVIAMLAIFVLHCTRFFDKEDWHVKASLAAQSDIWDIVRSGVIWVWVMPIFFLISGFASQYALKHRTGGQYLVDRARRLLVPLYTVGMLIIIPPQEYFERFTHGLTTLTFWEWLPSYYRSLPGDILRSPSYGVVGDPSALVPFTWQGHLWFLQMLFLVSLVTLPLLLLLNRPGGLRLIDRLAVWSLRPGGIFLFVIPLAVEQMALNWLPRTADRTWADFLWYALFFVYGYMFAADERFTQSIKRVLWPCVALWAVLYLVVGGFITVVLSFNTDPGRGFSGLYAAWQIIWPLTTWSGVVAMLAIGARYLSFTNRVLAYANEAVLPFYILHQTVILIVGWYVLPLGLPAFVSFLIIAAVSFPLILVIYEVFVKRIRFMRFLFGMTPLPPEPPAEATRPRLA